jgi:hypothetical protein
MARHSQGTGTFVPYHRHLWAIVDNGRLLNYVS